MLAEEVLHEFGPIQCIRPEVPQVLPGTRSASSSASTAMFEMAISRQGTSFSPPFTQVLPSGQIEPDPVFDTRVDRHGADA